jgi:hypothetical protein
MSYKIRSPRRVSNEVLKPKSLSKAYYKNSRSVKLASEPTFSETENGIVLEASILEASKVDKGSDSSVNTEGVFFKKGKALEVASELENSAPTPVVGF